MSASVQSSTITSTFLGRGSGTLAGVAFGPSDFTITAVGDTSNRVSLAHGYCIGSDTASITIASLGTYTFTTPTMVWDNFAATGVGFARGNGVDLMQVGPDPVFASWGMLTCVGPVSVGTGRLLQWSGTVREYGGDVVTSGGALFFTSATNIAATYSATVVPEPYSVLAIAINLGGMAVFASRSRTRSARLPSVSIRRHPCNPC
jgi:hypothetical protein